MNKRSAILAISAISLCTALSPAMASDVFPASRTDLPEVGLANQQSRKQVTGVVKDDLGTPVIGANVIEKGTTNGTITDVDGRFTLEVAAGASLEVSYIGYMTQTVEIGNQSELTIGLREDTQRLDEVVVVGYGTQTKREITGSVTNVTAEDFNQGLTRNAADLLQGKVAGLNITSGTGDVTSNATIQLRGMST